MTDSVSMLPKPASATGAGGWTDVHTLKEAVDLSFTVAITGAPTAVTVAIQGQLNGAIYTMAQHQATATELTDAVAAFSIAGKRADKVRYNVIDLTGGTSPTLAMSMARN